MSLERALSLALANPEAARLRLDMLDAEAHLIDFIKLMWPVLEPGRTFVDGWAVRAICEHLEAVTNGEIRKLLINVPPGCMKSLTCNVFWPAWEWGPRRMPSTRYVSAAYAEHLTIRDNRKARALIKSDFYQAAWGDVFQLDPGQDSKTKFDNLETGFKLATSVGGTGTGERGDRFIIDDPHNIKEGESEAKREEALMWFSEVVPTRVNDAEKSAFVLIMQRVHERDVSGLILSKELGYEHLCLPMEYEADRACSTCIGFTDPRATDGDLLWPERFPGRYLEEDLKPSLRAWGGEYAIAGQLQQRPAPRGGGMFKRDDLQLVREAPAGGQTVRGWDLAGSTERRSPWTVGTKVRRSDGGYYVLDVVRIQGTPGEVYRLMKTTADADGPRVVQDIPQDPGQAGKDQKRHVARLLDGHDVRFGLESGSKEDRARPFAAQSEAGNVYLVVAPWNDAYVRELETFPAGEFKDQVDASSRAYARLMREKSPDVGAAPKLIG